MSGRNNKRRDAIALILSTALHVIFLAFVINESATPYNLPQFYTPTIEPPVQIEIVPEERLPPTPVIPPKIKEALKKEVPPPPPRQPEPPKPTPQTPPTPPAPPKPTLVKPTPPLPAPPTTAPPTPAKPTPAPKPSPIAATPSPVRSPAPPSPTPSPTPAPKPAVRPAPTVAPPSPTPSKVPAPVIVSGPIKLNLHKPTKEAPAGVPTLPLAPAGQSGGGSPPGGGAPTGGSRLSGLSPYPYGAMPSGGPGLRGTLVGCANAEAVNLSSVERARCNERFGFEASKAPVLDGIDPAKRSRFDKTADRQERTREEGAAMPVGTTAGAQGLGGLGPN